MPQIIITPSANTTYTLFGFSGACSSSLTLTQFVAPLPNITANATPTSICKGNSTTLTASGATSYSWSNGSNQASAIVSPTLTTTYLVSATNNTCSATRTLSVKVDNCTNIVSNTSSKSSIDNYPNPFVNELYLKNTSNMLTTVRLINSLGKVVLEFKLQENEEYILNTTQLEVGYYMLETLTNNLKHSKKLIKL